MMSEVNGDVESFFGGAGHAAQSMHQHVQVAIDARVPDHDTLTRRGGRFGKFIARYRSAVINVGVACIVIASALVVYFFFSMIFFGVRFVLAAILHEIAAFFSIRSSAQTVAEHEVVNVMQPWRRVNDVYRASLLVRDISDARGDTILDYERVINRRFGQWSLASTQGRYNFTFDALEEKMANDIKDRRLPCTCYAEYGVPLSAVAGISSPDDVRYDVRIDGELCSEAERVSVHSALLDVVIDVLVSSSESKDAEMALRQMAKVCPKAVYDGISKSSGKRRRTEIEGEKLQCAKACVLLFDPALLEFAK